MSEATEHNLLERASDRISGVNAYIDGKMKRYSLMFAVNGGAFALAKLLPDPRDGHQALDAVLNHSFRESPCCISSSDAKLT